MALVKANCSTTSSGLNLLILLRLGNYCFRGAARGARVKPRQVVNDKLQSKRIPLELEQWCHLSLCLYW